MKSKGLFICKLQKDDTSQKFQGSSTALHDFEKIAAKQGWKTIKHRRMST